MRSPVEKGGIRAPLLLRSCGLRAITLLAVASCNAPATPRMAPPFSGVATDAWLAYAVPVPSRDPDELLSAFEAGAQRYGCRTETLGGSLHAVPRTEYLLVAKDDIGSRGGVTALCGDDTIALLTSRPGEVLVGCARPTTRARCDFILEQISETR